jgi:hypothetical protein
MNFNVLVAALLVLIFIAAQPAIALFLLAFAYVVSGPINTLLRYKAIKRKKSETRERNPEFHN